MNLLDYNEYDEYDACTKEKAQREREKALTPECMYLSTLYTKRQEQDAWSQAVQNIMDDR
jgi:vacuolar-type H+-ATPase subunit H